MVINESYCACHFLPHSTTVIEFFTTNIISSFIEEFSSLKYASGPLLFIVRRGGLVARLVELAGLDFCASIECLIYLGTVILSA